MINKIASMLARGEYNVGKFLVSEMNNSHGLAECRTSTPVCLAEMIEGKTKCSMVMDVSWVFAAFLVTTTVLGISIGTWIWMCRRRRNQIITAGPKSWPLLGSTLELTANFHRLFDWLTDYAMHFPTFEAKYIGFRLLFTVDPANVEHIMKTNFSNYVKVSDFTCCE